MRYARISEGTVAEIINLPNDIDATDAFHPDLSAAVFPCGEDVHEGWLYDGENFKAPEPDQADIEGIRQTYKTMIDAAAETERLKYITSGAGQALTYMQKSDEARRYLSDANPSVSDYPLLSAEVGITAPDIGGVASVVNSAYAQWQQIGAAIEAVRLGGKASLETAETADEVKSAYQSISWPTV